ncbi:MAG: RNB domain-containing ribonuclease [Terrabacter sp.]|nr:RNB domain-containing ribonuclease [Terrabacter sp.]
MAQRHIVFRPATKPGDVARQLTARFEAVRREFEVPDRFPPEVLAEAAAAAGAATLPERDETPVPFITIDPPTSMDLDQAMSIERSGDGYRVRYAIADVPAFVRAGGAVDSEARRRGQTVYCPDERVQLHPPELSEGAASLLPDQVRPAFVWDMTLAADGEGTAVEVYRAMVRSVRRYDYEQVQKEVDAGTAEECLVLLKEVGEKRVLLERKRGGATLPMPEQEVEEDEHGKIGILRTMPPPDPRDLARFRRQAKAAGVDWPKDLSYGELLRTLDRSNPRHLALIHEATSLFRGAGYTPFDGAVPAQPTHAAVANPYTHVTAPLRRLVDRFGLVVCEALSAGEEVPGWVREALPTLPEIMSASDRRTNGVERACTDAVEAAEVHPLVGSTVQGVVVDVNDKGVIVQLIDLAVVARASGSAEAGETVTLRVDAADIGTGTITLSVA